MGEKGCLEIWVRKNVFGCFCEGDFVWRLNGDVLMETDALCVLDGSYKVKRNAKSHLNTNTPLHPPPKTPHHSLSHL